MYSLPILSISAKDWALLTSSIASCTMSIALSQGFLLHDASVIEAAATIATAASINFFFIMNYRSRRVSALALDWFIKIKSARPYLLPVPLVEAFALPIVVERANLQKPHAEYVYTSAVCAPSRYCRLNIHNPQASTVCCIPDYDMKVAKFQQAKKERRVNASKKMSAPAPQPISGFRSDMHRQIYQNFLHKATMH